MIGSIWCLFSMLGSFVVKQSFLWAVLGRTRQFPGEDLDLHVRRFQEKALDCCDAVDEETMIDIC